MATWRYMNFYEITNYYNSNTFCSDWPCVSRRQHSPLFLNNGEESEIVKNIKEGIRLSVQSFEDDEHSVFSSYQFLMLGCLYKQPTVGFEWGRGLLNFARFEILKEQYNNIPADYTEADEFGISMYSSGTYMPSNVPVPDNYWLNLQTRPHPREAERSENTDFPIYSTSQLEPFVRPRCDNPHAMNNEKNFYPVHGSSPNFIPNLDTCKPSNVPVSDTRYQNLQARPNARVAERSEKKGSLMPATRQLEASVRPMCSKPKASAYNSQNNNPNRAKGGPLNKPEKVPATSSAAAQGWRRRWNKRKSKT